MWSMTALSQDFKRSQGFQLRHAGGPAYKEGEQELFCQGASLQSFLHRVLGSAAVSAAVQHILDLACGSGPAFL